MAVGKGKYGGGSVTPKKDKKGDVMPNTWRIQVFDPERKKQRERVHHGSEKEAWQALAGFAVAVGAQSPAQFDSRLMAFGQLLDEWLNRIERDGRAVSTINEHKRSIECEGGIREKLGSIRLSAIISADLTSFMDDLTDRGLKASSVRRSFAVCSAALSYAVECRYISESPADMAKRRRPKLERGADHVLTPADVEVLCAQADLPMEAAIRLALHLDCRRGELSALRWRDVDFGKGTVKVWRQLTRDEAGLWVETRTKTGDRKTITAGEAAMAILRALTERQRGLASSHSVEKGYVLSDGNGEVPIHPDKLTDRFRKLRDRAGLPKWVHLHSLRHAATSWLYYAGIDDQTVTRRGGWASPRMAQEVYGRPMPDGDVRAAAVMDKLLPAPSWAVPVVEVPASTGHDCSETLVVVGRFAVCGTCGYQEEQPARR